MNKQRHIERRETLAYWPAQNIDNGEAVGLVTDLSEEGIQIHSKHEFIKGKRLDIRIAVDAKLMGTDHITLIIENVWCRASAVPDLYHAGFKIVDISVREKNNLKSLLQAFSYPIRHH